MVFVIMYLFDGIPVRENRDVFKKEFRIKRLQYGKGTKQHGLRGARQDNDIGRVESIPRTGYRRVATRRGKDKCRHPAIFQVVGQGARCEASRRLAMRHTSGRPVLLEVPPPGVRMNAYRTWHKTRPPDRATCHRRDT